MVVSFVHLQRDAGKSKIGWVSGNMCMYMYTLICICTCTQWYVYVNIDMCMYMYTYLDRLSTKAGHSWQKSNLKPLKFIFHYPTILRDFVSSSWYTFLALLLCTRHCKPAHYRTSFRSIFSGEPFSNFVRNSFEETTVRWKAGYDISIRGLCVYRALVCRKEKKENAQTSSKAITRMEFSIPTATEQLRIVPAVIFL